MAYQKVSADEAMPDTALSKEILESLRNNPKTDADLAVSNESFSDSATLIREGASAAQSIRSASKRLSSKLGPLIS
jgi:hypothetical protein